MKGIFSVWFAVFSLLACDKEGITIHTCSDAALDPIPDILESSQSIQLDYFDNLFITNDYGLLIGGVYNQKYTLIRTDNNFEVLWTKNKFEWGNIPSPSGWWSRTIQLLKIFQRNDGSYVCVGSVIEGGDVISKTTLVIELNQCGEQIQKSEFTNTVTYDAILTSDDGLILFGRELIKLDRDYIKLWEKDISGGSYYQTRIIATSGGGFASTGTYDHEQIFLKQYDFNGNETSSHLYKHNEFPFNEAGFDLIQMDDMGFLIIGRTRNHIEPWDVDCQIIRTTMEGDTLYTKRFGNSSGHDWLDTFIFSDQNEFIIQGGLPVGHPKSILYKASKDGNILDSVQIARYLKMQYSPLKYFITVQNIDTTHVNLFKVTSDELFN